MRCQICCSQGLTLGTGSRLNHCPANLCVNGRQSLLGYSLIWKRDSDLREGFISQIGSRPMKCPKHNRQQSWFLVGVRTVIYISTGVRSVSPCSLTPLLRGAVISAKHKTMAHGSTPSHGRADTPAL